MRCPSTRAALRDWVDFFGWLAIWLTAISQRRVEWVGRGLVGPCQDPNEGGVMRKRSGMTIAAGLCAAVSFAGASPGDDGPRVRNEVQLVLQISGLGTDGCTVEIEPGHAGCKFKSVARRIQRIPAGSVALTNPITIDAESLGADRDCSFAITIKEPGKAARTYVRGLRLAPEVAGKPKPSRSLRCYINAPTVIAAGDKATRTR